jgi:flagellar hook-associated protein 2
MSTSSTMFTGSSRYATDFQSLLDRAVAIASLNLTQYNTQKTTLQSESTALSTLDTKFDAVQAVIDSLESATGTSSYAYSISNAAIVSASLGDGALAGTYTIEVTSPGSYTNSMSKDGLTAVTNPATQNISSASTFTLTVDGVETQITPASNTLSALVEAINDADADVQASIVNIGTSSSPDYRLTIQSTKLDAVTIQLNDGSNLLDTLAAGANATYKLNGMTSAISNDTRTITLAPGLTVTLLSESDPGVATTITVARSATAVSNALSSFVSVYNDAVDALDAHRGENGGALAGQSIVSTLWDALRGIAQYSSGAETIGSLTDLGLTFDDKGKLSFDSTTFSSATSGNFELLLTFLGSSTESGFLKGATDVLNGLQNPTDGVLQSAIDSTEGRISNQADLIDAEQSRVDLMEQNLTAQMAAADALIAALEQQATYITNLFESMRIAAQMFSA